MPKSLLTCRVGASYPAREAARLRWYVTQLDPLWQDLEVLIDWVDHQSEHEWAACASPWEQTITVFRCPDTDWAQEPWHAISTLDHELAHIIGYRGGPPQSMREAWQSAAHADQGAAEARMLRMGRRFSSSAAGGGWVHFWPAAITDEASLREDWAQSVRWYLAELREGQLGAAGDELDGPGGVLPESLGFADLWPARARLLQGWLAKRGMDGPRADLISRMRQFERDHEQHAAAS